MQVLLGKLNIRKLCLSTIAMGLIVLICAVIIQAPIKGRAEVIADANYTITYVGISDTYPTGFTDGTNPLTQAQIDNIGISAQEDGTSRTITLNGVDFTTTATEALKVDFSSISGTDTVIINLVGENSIVSTATGGMGIHGTKKLRFTGNANGNLTVSGASRGIQADFNVYFNQQGTITATANEGIAVNCPFHVEIHSGTLNVSGYDNGLNAGSQYLHIYGGSVIASASKDYAEAIHAYELEVRDATIKVNQTANFSYGIKANIFTYTSGNIVINENGYDIKGIRANNVNIGNGTSNPIVTINGNIKAVSNYQYESCGILADIGMIVNSGQINIDLRNDNNSDTTKISGIYVMGAGGLNIHGGTITSRLNMSSTGNTLWYGDNIRVKNSSIIIDGGTLELHTGGIGNGLHSTTGDINISGGTVGSSIYGTESKCIYSEGILNITGGTVNINSEEDTAPDKGNYGIYSNDNITIGTDGVTDNTSPKVKVTRQYGTDSAGIRSGADMTVYSGTVFVGKPSDNNYYYNYNCGIKVIGTLSVDGGIVTTKGSKNGIQTGFLDISGGEIYSQTYDNGSYSIDVDNHLNMTDGYVETRVENCNLSRGIFIHGTSSTSSITGGDIEVDVSGTYTKGIQSEGYLNIGAVGTQGPTIVVRGNIQNTDGGNFEEAGIFIKSDLTVYSGNIKIDLKNTKATNVGTSSNASNNYIVGIFSKESTAGIHIKGGVLEIDIDTKQSDGTYCAGEGMFTFGDISIEGGRVISKTNGGVYWVTNNGNKVLYHSSGIDAKKDLTITGGEVQAINTNTSNTYTYTDSETSEEKTIYIGVGLYSDAQINITGGHIIAQGISRALAAESTLISSEVIQNGIITILASENYSGNPLVEYESAKNDSYEYVEIGVRHTYYLRYDVAAKNIFVGPEKEDGSDVSLGDDADEDDTNDTEDILASMGITIDAANDTLILNNAIIESAVQYGLYIEGNATIQLAEKSVSRITANNAVDNEVLGTIKSICGIYCTGALTIKGPGELIVSGYDQAIKVSETGSIKLAKATEVGTDYDMIPLKGGTSADGVNVVEYPVISDTSAWNSYKYVHIGKMPVYFFRFNSSEGQMYKVVGSTATPIDKNQVVYGWSISTDKTLTLDDFDFVTSASNAFEVVGTEEAKIKIMDNCSITTLYNSQSSYNGIYCSVATTFSGTGKLNLSKNAVAGTTYTGINAAEGVSFTGGTYNIVGEECGIYVASGKKYKVSNTTIEASDTSSSTSKGAIYIDSTPSEFVVDEKVQVSSDKTGTSPTLVKDYNISGYSTYNTKPYIKIEPIVVSVSITWGDMNYVGNNEWNPNDHSYSAKISPSTTTSGLIKVVNNSTSNVPVYAQVDVNMTNTYSITAALGGSITNGAKKMLNVGENMEDNLKLSAPQPLSDINDEVVGTVSVTLSDYRQ